MSVSSIGSVNGFPSSVSGNATQPNLSAIIDDTTGKYRDDQKVQAYQEREARDEAVMLPAFQQGMATGDSTLPWRAWIKFLNTLSPEEQNSPRYRGTRQEALAAIAAGNGPNPVNSGPAGIENIQFGAEEPSKDGTQQHDKSLFGSFFHSTSQQTAKQQAQTVPGTTGSSRVSSSSAEAPASSAKPSIVDHTA